MNIQITPISFSGGQRIKIKVANNMEDYKRGFEIGSTYPKDKVEIELRKHSSNPKFASLVNGIFLNYIYSRGLSSSSTCQHW